MPSFWAKYNTQTTFEFPMIKRGVVDFAVSADWTPGTGDSAISKDGGNLADTTNIPAIVGGSPSRGAATWKLTLTAAELSCAVAHVQIIDASTKAVEDNAWNVYTYGNASAFFAGDWSDIVRLGLTALPNAAAEAAGGLYTRGTGAGQIKQTNNGEIDANATRVAGTAQTAGDIVGITGALNASASSGDPGTTTTLVQYLKQIVNTLEGSAGIPTFPAAANPGNAVSLAEAIRSIHANVGTAGAGLTNLGDTRVAHLDVDVSSRMATYSQPSGFLATTFPSGTVASSSEVTSIQNNTQCVRVVPDDIELPAAGTRTYRIELLLYDESGNMEAPDSAPTIALVNQAGTDRSSRLDSTTMALVSTGRYRAVYTSTAGDTKEQLVWTFSVIEGSATRLYGNTSYVTDAVATDFTTSDRTVLQAISDAVDTEVAAIKAKTDSLTFTVTNMLDVNVIDWKGATAPAMTGDAYARLGSPAGASIAADVASVKTDTGNLVTRITSTLFSGITNLSKWLGALAGKTADSGTLAEIQATTAGAGYDNTTDSQEALRDRGDSTWTPPSAAVVAAAVGAGALEGPYTRDQAWRLMFGYVGGKSSGATGGAGTVVLRDVSDTKNRISYVLDGNGNTTSVTIGDLS